MRLLFYWFALLFTLLVKAQPDTEVFLLDIISNNNNTIQLKSAKNISNTAGYDNQPFFVNDSILLYAGTNVNQTDIAVYNTQHGLKSWFNLLTEGSEYSPQPIPKKNTISAVRLDKNGLQRLYEYSGNGNKNVILNDLVVGYYVWHNPNTIVSFVLGSPPTLVISNVKKQKHDTIVANIGRSFHKIPNTNLISYISKKSNEWTINSINPKTKKTKILAKTLPNVEDMCWLPNGTILMGKGNMLYSLKPKKDSTWQVVGSLRNLGITNISRLAVNPSGTKLAVVGSPVLKNPENIINEYVNAFNTKDANSLAAILANNIALVNYPNQEIVSQKKNVKEYFSELFKQFPKSTLQTTHKTIINNKVIVTEQLSDNSKKQERVSIFEINNTTISKITFINN